MHCCANSLGCDQQVIFISLSFKTRLFIDLDKYYITRYFN